jgi:acyl-CoA thioesterase I
MKKLKFALLLAALVFVLLPATAQTRIMPLGDSVTSSFAPHTSYRFWLWQALIATGHNVDFVGTQHGVAEGEPGNEEFDQDHEGYPGWMTIDALEVIDSLAAADQPDIVLLDLGSNDVLEGIPLSETLTNLSLIIDHLRAANPNIVILLAQPTPYVGPNSRDMSKLKGALGKLAKQKRLPESPVIAVNLFGGFNVRKDTFDGVHPDESGEQKIAKKFFTALRKLLR